MYTTYKVGLWPRKNEDDAKIIMVKNRRDATMFN